MSEKKSQSHTDEQADEQADAQADMQQQNFEKIEDLEDEENGESINPEAGKPVKEEVSRLTGHEHPFVSEVNEGKPWFEWCVAGVLAIACIVALFHQFGAATAIMCLLCATVATVRLIAGQRSPWKIRSRAFDVIIGYGLAIGLYGTYLSILWITR